MSIEIPIVTASSVDWSALDVLSGDTRDPRPATGLLSLEMRNSSFEAISASWKVCSVLLKANCHGLIIVSVREECCYFCASQSPCGELFIDGIGNRQQNWRPLAALGGLVGFKPLTGDPTEES